MQEDDRNPQFFHEHWRVHVHGVIAVMAMGALSASFVQQYALEYRRKTGTYGQRVEWCQWCYNDRKAQHAREALPRC